ncbi:MAG: flagellar hook-basal body complex protein FliE [Burkholderiales bacterium]|nr:flagellar hook-basal body complex protein FliE [Burkholderiales bacterium]
MQGITPIDDVGGLGSLVKTAGVGGAADSAGVAGKGFADALKNALDEVSRTQKAAENLYAELQLGNPAVSLEETVIAQAKANIAFQAVVQTRNRLVSAYQDIMNMQV